MSALEQTSGGLSLGVPSLAEEAERERVRREHADYCGWQEGVTPDVGFHLWNLIAPMGHYPAGTTIAESTLDRLIAEANK